MAWARALWLGRKKFAERCRLLKEREAELQQRVRELEAKLQRERDAHRQLRIEVRWVEAEARSWVESPWVESPWVESPWVESPRVESPWVESPWWPDDPPLSSHGYGLKRMSLCVQVARRVGLRATEAVLRIVFILRAGGSEAFDRGSRICACLMLGRERYNWLGIAEPVPHGTTIRTWMQRLGVAAIEEPLEPADDWIWLADHSHPIGPEKVLVVLGEGARRVGSRCSSCWE